MNKLRLALLAALSLWALPTFAADSTVTAMPAAGALTGPELFYCIQGGVDSKCTATQVQTLAGPAGANLSLQYNNAGVFGTIAGSSWDAAAGLITLNPSSGSGTAFKVQDGGVDKITISRSGFLSSQNSIFANGSLQATTGNVVIANSSASLIFASQAYIRGPAAGTIVLGFGDAAAPGAQTLSVQNVVAGTTNTAGALWTQKGSAGTGTGVGGNIKWQVALAGGTGSSQNSFTDALTIEASAAVPRITANGPIKRKGYTVATLPTGAAGDEAYVTDQLTACPVLGGTFTGGGAVACSAFFDGAAWTHQ